MQNIAQEIRRFITDNFLFGKTRKDFTDEASFLDAGIIDSTGVLELVNFLEETYSFKVQDEELVPANLGSVKSVAEYVARKVKEGEGAAA